MKIAMIARSTLYTGRGGDTVQVIKTADYLRRIGVEVDIKLSNEQITYADYDLLHFFNIPRPADILRHSKVSGKPYVVSTILLDQSEYDRQYRRGLGSILKFFSPDAVEYIKTMARSLLGRDHLASPEFIWKGQRNSIIEILRNAAMLLPNSESEYNRLISRYPGAGRYSIVPNAADLDVFKDSHTGKDPNMVLCVARIEGNKNQLNLIRALNNTRFKAILVGKPAPNQPAYYAACRELAGANISFIDYLPLNELVDHYQRAKVHVLPSWFETTGLSTLEAAAMGCNIVITDKGDTRWYFEDYAFYCDPAAPQSILQAIEKASANAYDLQLYSKIAANYTWQKTAAETLKAYQNVLSHHPEPIQTIHESIAFN